jgi:hypothetical protein
LSGFYKNSLVAFKASGGVVSLLMRTEGVKKRNGGVRMAKEIKKVIIIDTSNYFFVDQAHLLEKIRASFGTSPVYFVVNPENKTWQQASQKFIKVWSKYNAMTKLSQNVDMDLVENVVRESDAKKVVVGSNDGRLLWQIAENAVAKPVYLRITYKQKNGKWMRPPDVLEKLRNYGYTVIDWRLANRIEGALARMLVIGFDEALELWEQREKFKRSVVLARERVLPKIEQEISLQGFSALCEKENILFPFETVYFLALFGYINIQSKNRVVVISPIGKKVKREGEEQKQEELVKQEEAMTDGQG